MGEIIGIFDYNWRSTLPQAFFRFSWKVSIKHLYFRFGEFFFHSLNVHSRLLSTSPVHPLTKERRNLSSSYYSYYSSSSTLFLFNFVHWNLVSLFFSTRFCFTLSICSNSLVSCSWDFYLHLLGKLILLFVKWIVFPLFLFQKWSKAWTEGQVCWLFYWSRK